jgi:hypothetical protein
MMKLLFATNFYHFRAIFIMATVCFSLFNTSSFAQEIPVVPGLFGWGTTTPAGRGGEIIRVTNLNPSGPGSLKEAMESSGRRVVIFEVSGTIILNDWIRITDPYLTVAGQTAPSPGISIRSAGIRIMTHDVLLQHLRIRVGGASNGPRAGERDGIEILSNSQDCYNIVIDHCSASWAIDETMSIYVPNRTYSCSDITVSNCIISEALMEGHPNPDHKGDGFLVGSTNGGVAERISLIRNVFAHNNARNPTSQGSPLAMINNLVWDWGGKCVLLRSEGRPNMTSVIGNAFIRSNQSAASPPVRLENTLLPGSAIYLNDNYAPGYSQVHVNESSRNYVTESPTDLPSSMVLIASSSLEDALLDMVGARPLDRDEVDDRVIEDIRTRDAYFIDDQWDVGGWPPIAEHGRELYTPSNPHGDDDGDGYTNLEEWIHSFTTELDPGADITAIPNKDDFLVSDYVIDQNFPNPFNPSTTIGYAILNDAYVTLRVYNMLGQEVASLVDGYQTAGRKSVTFDAAGLSAGTYVYRFEADGSTESKKMLLVK